MTTGSILLSLALLMGVAFFVARPFLMPASSRRHLQANSQRQNLLAQKEKLLAQLQALEFDLATGKVPEEIYQTQRATWTSEAAGILRQLDQLDQTSPTTTAIDRQIEDVVRRLRFSPPPTVSSQPAFANGSAKASPMRSPEPMVEVHQQPTASSQQPVATRQFRFCPHCGQPIDPGDNFCAGCGHKLTT